MPSLSSNHGLWPSGNISSHAPPRTASEIISSCDNRRRRHRHTTKRQTVTRQKDTPSHDKNMNINNLRELLATSVILGMCAGRWGRNGSSQRRIRAPKSAKFRCRRDRGFYFRIPPAETPQILSTDRRICKKKSPIGTRHVAAQPKFSYITG